MLLKVQWKKLKLLTSDLGRRKNLTMYSCWSKDQMSHQKNYSYDKQPSQIQHVWISTILLAPQKESLYLSFTIIIIWRNRSFWNKNPHLIVRKKSLSHLVTKRVLRKNKFHRQRIWNWSWWKCFGKRTRIQKILQGVETIKINKKYQPYRDQ